MFVYNRSLSTMFVYNRSLSVMLSMGENLKRVNLHGSILKVPF